MPIYEYRCEQCGERFEKLVRGFSGEAGLTCPRCGSDNVKKAVSLFGLGGGGGRASDSGSSCGPTSL
ncbi:MAG: zinc ribbon domain-containing protein [Anaerolineae bacterium]|nr:zinc ribbon domain-containing protein [Anaerolineae bacterium]